MFSLELCPLVKSITKRTTYKLRPLILSDTITIKLKNIWNKALNIFWIVRYLWKLYPHSKKNPCNFRKSCCTIFKPLKKAMVSFKSLEQSWTSFQSLTLFANSPCGILHQSWSHSSHLLDYGSLRLSGFLSGCYCSMNHCCCPSWTPSWILICALTSDPMPSNRAQTFLCSCL